MKKISLLLLILCGTLKGQFFQYGFQVGFFPKQTIKFNSPVNLDSNFKYNSTPFTLEENLIKEKKSNTPTFEPYLNYRINQNTYIGLNYKYSKQASNNNGIYNNYDYPTIDVKTKSLGLVAGYTKNKFLIDFFAEGGVSVSTIKFKFDWKNVGSQTLYTDYLNQNNLFLNAFGNVGFKLFYFSFSTRYDFCLAALKNPSNIKFITYRPTFNIGVDLTSAFIGTKKITSKKTDITQFDEDAQFSQKYEYPKLVLEYGATQNLIHLKMNEPSYLSYNVGSTTSQIKFNDNWNQFNIGLFGSVKYAPFTKKKLFLSLFFGYGNSNKSRKVGEITSNYVSGNFVNSTVKDLNNGIHVLNFGIGSGYRFRVSDKSHFDVSPIIDFINFDKSSSISAEVRDYIVWSKGITAAYGINASYKWKHYGISFKTVNVNPKIEANNAFKKVTMYSLSLFFDYGIDF